jgi:putative sterol carrier protein
MAMADPTSDFFGKLGQPGSRRLGKVTGSIRIDLDSDKATEHWLVAIDKGNISVSRKNVKADAALHADKEIFDRLAQGEASPLASMLRGLVRAEGDAELIVLFQGLFPAPHDPLSRQDSAGMEGQPA